MSIQTKRSRRFGAVAVGTCLTLSLSLSAFAAEKVTIIGPFGDWGDQVQQAFKAFTKKTGIEVDVIMATGWPDLFEKVVTMSAAGVPPDVVYGDNLRIMDLAERGLLEAIDPLARADALNMRRYPPAVLEGLRIKDVLYSLPTAVSINATIYNTDLFAQAGVNELPTNWLGDELNWDEFVTMSRKLTKQSASGGNPEIYGLGGFGSYGGFNMIGMWGAQDVDRDRTRYLGTDPKVIRAMTFSSSLWLEHNVVGGNFLSSTAAAIVIQPYYLNNLLRAAESGNRLNWRVGILPKGDVRASQASFHSLGITARSNNKKNAWQLVKYLAYEPEGAVMFTRAENRVPVLRETAEDFVRRYNQMVPGSRVHVFSEAVQVLWDWRILSGSGGTEISSLLNEAWNRIRLRQSSVTDAIELIAPRVNAALQRK